MITKKFAFIFAGLILVGYGIKIILVPKFFNSKYGMYHDFSAIKWPLGSGLIIAGVVAFVLAYMKAEVSGLWMCKSCIKPFSRNNAPDLICPICNDKLEELEGFYERHPELKDKKTGSA